MPLIDRAECHLRPLKLERPVGGSGVSAVDVLITELYADDGARGMGFSYVLGGGGGVAAAALEAQLERHVRGRQVPAPAVLWRKVAAGFNRTGPGPNTIALASLDVAAWDLHARRMNQPLGVAFGGELRPVRVYGSGGFHAQQAPEAARDVALGHLQRGLSGVKPRAGGGPADRALLQAVRDAVGPEVALMVDANERCDLPGAMALVSAAAAVGAAFVEEPLPATAYAAYRRLSVGAGLTPLAGGEHLQTTTEFVNCVRDGVLAVLQPDLAMMGGLTPILKVAALAEAFGLVVTPHFLPGLFAHLAAASPAVGWLEDFPLLEPMFEGWPTLGRDGALQASEAPGHGLTLAA